MREPFGDLYEDVDVEQLKRGLEGSEYRFLVQTHVRRGKKALLGAIAAGAEMFTDEERSVAEDTIDRFNGMAYEKEFWRRDCGEVFSDVCAAFEVAMDTRGLQTDDATRFHIFQAVTVNFAWSAINQKAMRKFAGIRKGLFFR